METADQDRTALLDSILDEALQCVRQGGVFGIDEYCRRFPGLAEELHVMLPALTMLEKPFQDATVAHSKVSGTSAPVPPNLADFQIVAEIGRGAMGVVYEAIQRPLSRRVALKVLYGAGSQDDSHPLRFRREAEIAARLHHTNIIPVFEAGESAGHVYYAMQLIEGANLQQLIAAQGSTNGGANEAGPGGVPNNLEQVPPGNRISQSDETVLQHGSTKVSRQPPLSGNRHRAATIAVELTPQTCAQIALQVAEGLDFAHERGILHRDIKPSNVMLDQDGRAWIADFGLAKANEGVELTATGDVVGTVRYLAPERFRGQSDHRSDIYALGLTLFEMLERRPAWPATDRAQLIQQIVGGGGFRTAGRAVGWSADLRRIVEKSTACDPVERYQRAGELAADLRRFLDGRPVLARKQSVLRSLLFWTRRNPLPASLVATIAALLVGGLVAVSILLVRERRQSRIADENFHTALETVRTYLTAVSDSTELKASGAEQLRRELLTAAQSYYESFARNHRDDPELRSELADAEFLLGRIHQETGDLATAVACFEQARELLASGPEVPAGSGDPAYLIRLLQNLGDANRLLGNWEAAERSFIEARDLARQLFKRSPGNVGLKLQVADIESQLGLVYGSMNRADDESGCYDQASDLVATVGPGLLDDDELTGDLINILKKLGAARRLQGRLDEARVHYGTVIDLSRQLSQRQPDQSQHGASLANGYLRLGELDMFEGRLPESREALTEAAEVLDGLIDRHPMIVSYREGRGTCQVNLGQTELAAGEFAAAESAWLLALQTYTRLAEDCPASLEYRFATAQTQANLGSACYRLGRPADAIEYTRQAFRNLQLLLEQNPDHPEFAEVHSGIGSNLAALLNADGRPDEAMEILLDSIRVHEILLTRQPGLLSTRAALANAHINASSAAKEMMATADALRHLGQAVSLLEGLRTEHSGVAEYRVSLAVARNLAGMIHYEAGQTKAAEPEFRESLWLYEALAEEQPDNPSLLRWTGMLHHSLAMNLREAGRSDEALKHFDSVIETLEAVQELTAPGIPAGVGNYRLERAKALGRLGRFADAITECQRACAAGGEVDRDCAAAITAQMLAAKGNWEEGLQEVCQLDGVRFGDPRDAIELAAAWALLGQAVVDGSLTLEALGEDSPASAEGCFLRAIALIETAIGQGLRNVALFDSIAALDALREREDYGLLMERIGLEPD